MKVWAIQMKGGAMNASRYLLPPYHDELGCAETSGFLGSLLLSPVTSLSISSISS